MKRLKAEGDEGDWKDKGISAPSPSINIHSFLTFLLNFLSSPHPLLVRKSQKIEPMNILKSGKGSAL
jgi:hypothetical protein